MAENKRYYWLKLKDDFFKQKEIKKLRKIAGGETYVIIYLKMQLLSLNNSGKIFFEGFENNVCEELALELDEEIENVNVTFRYLKLHGLIQEVSEDEFLMSKVPDLLGSETYSTVRSRACRARKKENDLLQSNAKMLQCNVDATLMQQSATEI